MVLPALLSKFGLSGIAGLSQGGGFGLGYGFMVRAGYDLYGQMRDKVMQALTGARYTPDTATSMMGTGGLMGMQRTDQKPSVDTTSLNVMQGLSPQRISSLSRKLGGTHKIENYLRTQQGHGVRHSTANNLPIHPRTGKQMSQWYYDNVYLARNRRGQRRADTRTFFSNFNLF